MTEQSTIKPHWPICNDEACIGVQVADGMCLAHAGTENLADTLSRFGETGQIDARGVQVGPALLHRILAAAPSDGSGRPELKIAQFDGVTFTGGAKFDGATFTGHAGFVGATFTGDANFGGVTFTGDANFYKVTIASDANFVGVTFTGDVNFYRATIIGHAKFYRLTFTGDANFGVAAFTGDARFNDVTFTGDAKFDRATFTGRADFDGVTFTGDAKFDRTTFTGRADFAEATFTGQTGFVGATFVSHAAFVRATFIREAALIGATFKGHAIFYEAEFSWSTFRRANFARVAFFARAKFTEGANFNGTTFAGETEFGAVNFIDEAHFAFATFNRQASFKGATFTLAVTFEGANFTSDATFTGTAFSHDALFKRATFIGEANFRDATLARNADFRESIFIRPVSFERARFEQARQFGPLLSHRGLVLDEVEFTRQVQVEVSTIGLSCCRARFPGGVVFRLRWARVVLDDADFPAPSILAGIPKLANGYLADQEQRIARAWQRLLGREISERPQLLSLRRANVAGLGLSNLSTTDCLFAGAHNLDKLRLEADVSFGSAPSALRNGPRTWGRRQVLAEERLWRATRTRRWAVPQWPGWVDRPVPGDLKPGQIAALYRALRKGREDAKDQPGAADFYFGEMEMRRLARPAGGSTAESHASTASRGRVERTVLAAYWLVSGYGLRSWRALAVLVAIATIFAVLFHIVGFTAPPQPVSYWTSLLYAFRSALSLSDDEVKLTAWGKLLQGLLRLTGPVLLGLTLLALRGRVKR